jgi:hypothetical protein
MAAGEAPLDWSAAESLAFASLACSGIRIRLTGQDSERGTSANAMHTPRRARMDTPMRRWSIVCRASHSLKL